MTWIKYLDDALGVYSKRDCPGGDFKCRGTVYTGAFDNSRFLFVPHNKGLNPVEAEMGGRP